MILLMTTDGKAYVSYLAHIFEELHSLDKQLQWANATFCNAKAKIFGFVTFLNLYRSNILPKKFVQILCLKECDVTQDANTVIAEHLEMLINDFNAIFHDLKTMELSSLLKLPNLKKSKPDFTSSEGWISFLALSVGKLWPNMSEPRMWFVQTLKGYPGMYINSSVFFCPSVLCHTLLLQ